MTTKFLILPLFSILAFTAACSSTDKDSLTASVKGGDFELTPEGEDAYGASFSGYAHLVITNTSSTVEVYVKGLTAGEQYNTHVHEAWCSSSDDKPGGGHYLQNPEGEDEASNGLWPMITVVSDSDDNTVGMGFATNEFVVTEGAKSVVIHEYGSSDRIACVDLRSSAGLSGTFAITDAGQEIYDKIEGSTFVGTTDLLSKAYVSVTGLSAEETYKTHVHDGDCASGGGGHYLQDSGEDDIASNGLWPIVSVDAFGYGVGWASNGFSVRLEDTQSVVVHEPESGERIACSDLSSSLLAFRNGVFWATDIGNELYGSGAISGRAKLSVSATGVSSLAMYVSGLTPDTDYKAHVHSGDCQSGGGKHYWQNMETKADVPENGLFPYFTTGTAGTGMVEVSNSFIVRPDARSVVIHETGGVDDENTGKRIACADLN